MLKSIHHIAIICSDYEKSKAFYTEILGFGIMKETYRKEREFIRPALLSVCFFHNAETEYLGVKSFRLFIIRAYDCYMVDGFQHI